MDVPPSRRRVRGEMVDVGGRRLRLVRAGTASNRPVIVCEHGAFGCAADWAVVQDKLAAKGLYSLAYDRAGLGHSDPGPTPRDGVALAQDLERLLAEIGEERQIVFVGHSMGGLMARVFTRRNRARVVGVVLVDAVTPEMWAISAVRPGVAAFGRSLQLAAVGARFGAMRPLALVFGNLTGLTGEPAIEKRRIWGSPAHSDGAAREVMAWAAISAEAGREPFDPQLPVAVVTAGVERARPALKLLQAAPAAASRHGYVEHVAGSNHASLLGARFADPVVRGVEHVLKAAGL